MFPLFLLYLISVSAQDIETNNKCSYTLKKSVFTCDGLTDVNKNVDKFLTPNTRMLVIKNSDNARFESFHHNSNDYKYLINYNIIENKQLELEEQAFFGLTNLHYMKITKNFLPQIKNRTFFGLDKLELLNLEENNITKLEPSAFSGLRNLLTLDIAKNNIEVIEANLFLDLTKLQTLLLERNNIKIIEENGFSGLVNLKLFDLTSNSLTKFDGKEFNRLRKLDTLYLGFNKIETIESNLNLPELMFLQLDNNRLESIEDDCFKSVVKAESIDLSHNKLAKLTEKPFLKLLSLQFLNLGANNVSKSKFINLRNPLIIF